MAGKQLRDGMRGFATREKAGDGGEAAGKPHYHGHRQRLRDRFMATGGDGMPDYEILELLLSIAVPRVDTKPLAKALLDEFKSFAGVITAEPAALRQLPGMGEVSTATLKIVQAAAVRLDSLGWARYGFGREQDVRDRLTEVAALSPQNRS